MIGVSLERMGKLSKKLGKKRGKKTKRIRRSPEQTKELLLKTTQKLLQEYGPGQDGLKDVAQAAGVTHGLVGHYFGSIETLIEKAFEESIVSLRQNLVERIVKASNEPPSQWITTLFDTIEQPEYFRVAAWAALSHRTDRQDFFARRLQGLRLGIDALENYLKTTNSSNVSRLDIECYAVFILSTTFGYAIGRDVLWASAGITLDETYENAFRERFQSIVKTFLPPPAAT
jgi:TetR/AcrR family transcriptional regulator, repressor for neighboring sulfatase